MSTGSMTISAGIERPDRWSSGPRVDASAVIVLGVDDAHDDVAARHQQVGELPDVLEDDGSNPPACSSAATGSRSALGSRIATAGTGDGVELGTGQPSASGSRAVTWMTPSALPVTRAAKPGMVGSASRNETSGRG